MIGRFFSISFTQVIRLNKKKKKLCVTAISNLIENTETKKNLI